MRELQDGKTRLCIGKGSLQELDACLRTHYSNRDLLFLLDEKMLSSCLPLLKDGLSFFRRSEFRELQDGRKGLFSVDSPRVFFEIVRAEEQYKGLALVEHLWRYCTEHCFGRDACIVNVGGGVLGDLGGFVAATYVRGVDFIQVPTTLLSMVDACVGGKTAFNFCGIKNNIGAFHRPEAVFIDPAFLNSLPREEVLSGIGEIVKMYAISEKNLNLEWVDGLCCNLPDLTNIEERIYGALREKIAIVTRDFQETSERRFLNFGHTLGHGIEALAWTKNLSLTHGEAVVYGMLGEIYWSVKYMGFSQEKFITFAECMVRHFRPIQDFVQQSDLETLWELMCHDKKNANKAVSPVLLEDFGSPCFGKTIQKSDLAEFLEMVWLEP